MRQFLIIFNTILILSCASLIGCQEDPVTTAPLVAAPKVTASAELISLSNATIGPPNISRMWQYKIQKMAPENKQVKKGEVILVFDGQKKKNDLMGRESRLKAEIKKAESNKLKDEATTPNLILKLAEAEMEYEKAKRKADKLKRKVTRSRR